jgi:hypothetical protein
VSAKLIHWNRESNFWIYVPHFNVTTIIEDHLVRVIVRVGLRTPSIKQILSNILLAYEDYWVNIIQLLFWVLCTKS